MVGSIISQILLIAINAVFSSAEFAVLSCNDARIKQLSESGNRAAHRLLALKELPARFVSTIQSALTLTGFLSSAFAAYQFSEPLSRLLRRFIADAPLGTLRGITVLLITLVLACLFIVLGELVPKRIAMRDPDRIALKLSRLLKFASALFTPLVWLLTHAANGVLRLMRIDPNQQQDPVTEEEIRMLLIEGNEAGIIPEEENEIIQNVFEFDDTQVSELCVHRRDVVMLCTQDSMEEWEQTILENRLSFYPICSEDPDDIIGVLDTKDYFRMKDRSRETVLTHAVDPAFFIPETMRANILFRKMKLSRKYFAVVVDEYGSMSGIITLHDLVEALVGELEDMDEPPRPKDIEQLSPERWRVQGYAELEELEEKLGISLVDEDCETFSGLVCKIIDRIPDDGESFSCETERLSIEVKSVSGHVIGECIVTRKPDSSAQP